MIYGAGAAVLVVSTGSWYFFSHSVAKNIPLTELKPFNVTTTTEIKKNDTAPTTDQKKNTQKTPLVQKNAIPSALIGKWSVTFGNGELSGERTYTFAQDGTYQMTGYPAIEDSGTYKITEAKGTVYTLALTTKTGYAPAHAIVTVTSQTLIGLDNLGTYHRSN